MTRPFDNLARWFPAVLCSVVWIAYANSLSGAFLFDDYPVLLSNPFINNVWPPWEAGQSPHLFTLGLFCSSGVEPAPFYIGSLLKRGRARTYLLGKKLLDLRCPLRL